MCLTTWVFLANKPIEARPGSGAAAPAGSRGRPAPREADRALSVTAFERLLDVSVCQQPEPRYQDQDEYGQGVGDDLSGDEQEVEDAMQHHPEDESLEDDPRTLFCGRELGPTEGVAPDTGEKRMPGDREDRTDNDRAESKRRRRHVRRKDVEDVLERCEPESGCCGVDDAVHRFVELGVRVSEPSNDPELAVLLDDRRNDDAHDQRECDEEAEEPLDEGHGERDEDAEEEELHDQRRRFGIEFIPAVEVPCPEDSRPQRQGKDHQRLDLDHLLDRVHGLRVKEPFPFIGGSIGRS